MQTIYMMAKAPFKPKGYTTLHFDSLKRLWQCRAVENDDIDGEIAALREHFKIAPHVTPPPIVVFDEKGGQTLDDVLLQAK